MLESQASISELLKLVRRYRELGEDEAQLISHHMYLEYASEALYVSRQCLVNFSGPVNRGSCHQVRNMLVGLNSILKN